MYFSRVRRTQILALAVLALGLVNLLSGDWVGGIMWVLLAGAALLYQPPPGGRAYSLREIGWSPRTAAAAVLILAALVIVVVRLVTAFMG